MTYVTSMPQLRHCKATLNGVILSVPQPLVMMALCTKKLDGSTPEFHQSTPTLCLVKYCMHVYTI